jgi:hypothetical protein
MVPKKYFLRGSMEQIDRVLLLIALRKKVMYLIFNILENDLLNEQRTEIEDSNNKIYVTFLKNILSTLIDYYITLLHIEVVYSTTENSENMKKIHEMNFWGSILASSQFIENLINLIRDDSFSFKYPYENIKSVLKTVNDDLRNNNIVFEENMSKYPILSYEKTILNFLFQSLLSYKQDKFENNKSDVEKLLNNSYKQAKNLLKRLDDKILVEYSYGSVANIFEVENSFYQKLLDMFAKLNKDEFGEINKLQKYELITDTLNKICVIVLSFIEKFEKDNQENLGSLPIKPWFDFCAEVSCELEESARIKDELDESLQKLRNIKLEKIELENKITELSNTKSINDKKLGEALIQSGKVAQLEAERDELNSKIQRYNITVDNLRQQIEIEIDKNKELSRQLETSKKDMPITNKQQLAKLKDRRNGLEPEDLIQQSSIVPSMMVADSLPMLNTILQLQRERKSLKSKLMKDKLFSLFNEVSFVNKYIQKNKNSEDYEKQEEWGSDIQHLNETYRRSKRLISCPKVYDISDKEYNYTRIQKVEENKINEMRIDYMETVDKLLVGMFGDVNYDKLFKEVIDNDISRALSYYGEKKLLVGKLNLSKNDNAKKIPIYLSEQSLKNLNRTFMH